MDKGREPYLLVVDDDPGQRSLVETFLRSQGHRVETAASGADALKRAEAAPPALVISDVRMPGMTGLELLRAVKRAHPGLPVLLVTAYAGVRDAIGAIRDGAADYLEKPIDLDELAALVRRLLNTGGPRPAGDAVPPLPPDVVAGSGAMREALRVTALAAPSDARLLITGETGTGKEVVAGLVHQWSPRAGGPFVKVNCAAIPENLLESELFGHEKGAFTGADARRKGRFELAVGGTLFLDEIGEIDSTIQVKLLRVIEERQFERVGGTQLVEADIRLIAATNRDLRQLVQEGKFREDLLYRLDVVNIRMPPLSERSSDIPALCEHFLKEFSTRNGKPVIGITAEAVNLLSAYAWPGNVRELRNTIEKMVVLAHNDRLTARDVPANIREAVRGTPPGPRGNGLLAEGSLAETEWQKIMAVLAKQGGNRTRAALELGISRRTLHRKLQEYRAQEAGDKIKKKGYP